MISLFSFIFHKLIIIMCVSSGSPWQKCLFLSLPDTIYHDWPWLQQLKCELLLTLFIFNCNMHVWLRPKSIIQHVVQVFYDEHILMSDLQDCWLRMFIPASNLFQVCRSYCATPQMSWETFSFPLAETYMFLALQFADTKSLKFFLYIYINITFF